MENLTTNKKIGLACAIALIISFFLPYISEGMMTISLMDMAELTAKVWIWPLCGAAAAFLTFKDNVGMARIAFIVSLGFWVYFNFLAEFSPGMDIFSVAGIGCYLLVASSAIGAVFSKN
tara:strand:- start:68 stop:424 length:357 start_codon:yes stop_codon:yes gene_type:complete